MNDEQSTPWSGASPTAIKAHYDLSNDFYQLWLDREMNYSCALWEEGDDLDTAQVRKLDYHIRQANAANQQTVLDVGCGWGATLRRLVGKFGVRRAVGLTLSDAQADYVTANSGEGIEVHRHGWEVHEPDEEYDAIISIGAFEHFSKLEHSTEEKIENYRKFFSFCHRSLVPGGRMSLQAFAYSLSRLDEETTDGTHFLANRIFPETDPPHLSEIVSACAGLFEIKFLRNDNDHYARTCALWAKNLKNRMKEAVEMVGQEKVDDYLQYLQLSRLGFDLGRLCLYRITFVRSD